MKKKENDYGLCKGDIITFKNTEYLEQGTFKVIDIIPQEFSKKIILEKEKMKKKSLKIFLKNEFKRLTDWQEIPVSKIGEHNGRLKLVQELLKTSMKQEKKMKKKEKSKIREMIDNWRKYSQIGCCEWDLDDLEEMIEELIKGKK